jgi:hypothetical protein
LAKRAEDPTAVTGVESVQLAKEQAQRIDDAMVAIPIPTATEVSPKALPKVLPKHQMSIKEKKIPQRRSAPKRSMLDIKGEPDSIVTADVETNEEPKAEAEDPEPIEMDEEDSNAEQDDEDAGKEM